MKPYLLLLLLFCHPLCAADETGIFGTPLSESFINIAFTVKATRFEVSSSTDSNQNIEFAFCSGLKKSARKITQKEFYDVYLLASRAFKAFHRTKAQMPSPGLQLQSLWVTTGVDQAMIMFDERGISENPLLGELQSVMIALSKSP